MEQHASKRHCSSDGTGTGTGTVDESPPAWGPGVHGLPAVSGTDTGTDTGMDTGTGTGIGIGTAHASTVALSDNCADAVLDASTDPSHTELALIVDEIFDTRQYMHGGKVALKDGDVVVDVGAHVGVFSLFCLREAKIGTLLAFEPMGAQFKQLQANLHKHCTPYHATHATHATHLSHASQATHACATSGETATATTDGCSITTAEQEASGCAHKLDDASVNSTGKTQDRVLPTRSLLSAPATTTQGHSDQLNSNSVLISGGPGGGEQCTLAVPPSMPVPVTVTVPHVRVFQLGLSDSATDREFTFFPKMPGNSTLHPQEKFAQIRGCVRDTFQESEVEVRGVTTLKEVFKKEGVQRVDLLKVGAVCCVP